MEEVACKKREEEATQKKRGTGGVIRAQNTSKESKPLHYDKSQIAMFKQNCETMEAKRIQDQIDKLKQFAEAWKENVDAQYDLGIKCYKYDDFYTIGGI